MKKILSLFLATVILISSIAVSLMVLTSAEASQNLISNPGFENGLEGWTLHNGAISPFNASVVDTDKHEGTYSLHRYVGGGTSNIYNQIVYITLNLEEGARYNLKFWIKGDPAWGRFYISDNKEKPENQDSMILHNQWQGVTFTDWTEQDFTFKSPETKSYILCFYIAAPTGDIYLDDFSLVKTSSAPPAAEDPDNVIKNGGFESELENWVLHDYDSGKEVNAKISYFEKHAGENSLHRWNTQKIEKQSVYQSITLEPNTEYKLSLYLKGNPAYGRLLVGTNKEKPFETSGAVFNKQITSKYNDWKKLEYTFTSNDETDYLFVLLFHAKATDVYVDDVSIKKVGGNLFNPGFEKDLEGWEKYNGSSWTAFDGNVVTTEKHKGECSFHRVVKSDKSIYNQIFYTPLKLKEKTSYTLSFWMKGNPGWGRFYISENTTDVLNQDKTLIVNQWTESYSDWTKFSYSFLTNTVKNVNLCFYFSSPQTDVYLDDFSLIENDRKNLVANGSFQYAEGGWELDEGFKVNSQLYMDVSKGFHKNLSQTISFPGGNMKADFDGWLNQVVTVEKGNSYSVSVDAYLPESQTDGCDIEFVAAKTIDDIIAGNGTAIILSEFAYGENYWQTLNGEYLPEDSLFAGEETKTQICFALRSKSKNANLRLDNVKFGTLALNSDFEATEQKNVAWRLDGESLKLQNIAKGLNYKLSFKYKGVNFEDNMAMFTLSRKTDFDPVNAYIRGYVTKNAIDWTEHSVVFDSGSYQQLELIFQTLSNEYSVDDIRIAPTTEAVTIEPIKRAYVGDMMSGSYYEKYKQPADGKNIIINDDFVGESTSGYNNALNFVATSNGGESAGEIIGNGSETDASYLGNSSLKFTAGLKEETVSIPLSLQKNTGYVVGLYIKTGKYIADSDGWSRLSYGIGDTSSGNFIRVEDITAERQANLDYADRIQFIPRFDEEWHYVGFTFTTNDQTDLSFMLRGTRITAYVDKLYIWENKASHTTNFKATLDKVGPVKNIKPETELLDMSSKGTNLVENFDFEAGTKFWEQDYRRVGVYGNNLTIKNSNHTVQKNSFLYENQLIYPWNCYYIQWIDVKPNTDYTFSAKYAITETGDGIFGIIPGYKSDSTVNKFSENMLYPSNGLNSWLGSSEEDMYIAHWDFNEANYDPSQNWQTVGVTFNSGDRNRIGFFIQDGGGTAYIDDVKVFETQYAVKTKTVSDNFPKKIEVKNKNITVKNGLVKGIKKGTKLSDVADLFKNSKYIRFFDVKGEEITDSSAKAATGIEVRLMNGPVIKDRATVVIPGDVTGDGALKEDDSEAILKHITIEKSLDGVYLEAADYDGDGKVTVYDVLFNKKSAKTGTAEFSFTDPEKILIGGDIELSLVTDVKNIYALSGRLVFNSEFLTFKSVDTNLKGWKVSSVDSDGEVIFAAMNSAKNKGTLKGKAVVTFTFTVGNLSKIEDIAVGLRDGVAATDDKFLKVKNCEWPKTEVNKETKPEEEVEETKPENSGSNENVNNQTQNNGSSGSYVTTIPGTTTEVTTVVKAANRLAILKLDEAEISPEFDPETREYTATVPFEVDKVTVTAVAENDDATVTIGDTNLEYIGKNAVTIEVVSADGLKRAYRIIVTREAPTKSGNASKDATFPVWAIILIIVGAALIIAAVVFLLIIILNRKRKTA